MVVKKIFSEDLQIAKSLIVRDEMVTRKYFYQQCYPLFKSIYDNYYTDCANCKEFIDDIHSCSCSKQGNRKMPDGKLQRREYIDKLVEDCMFVLLLQAV